MKIIMRTVWANDRYIRHPGEITEVSEIEGRMLVEGGYAQYFGESEIFDAVKELESTMLAGGDEKQVEPTPKPRRRRP